MLTDKDKKQLQEKGISEEMLKKQLDSFRVGFPFLSLVAPASIGSGIKTISEKEASLYLDLWDSYRKSDKVIYKFVPASGAASRMFKDLFSFLDAPYTKPTTDSEKLFFDNLHKFAFFNDLNAVCCSKGTKNVDELLADGEYKEIVKKLLLPEGLNYGNLPKGLLKFHKYPQGSRTPVEEHLKEGFLYAKNDKDAVNIHFTVSPEHHSLFQQLIDERRPVFESELNVKYSIGFSEQKPSTDTIAVDSHNQPFRDGEDMVFRPGGHGALIQNLNDLDADIVFIKNIDNVVPDRLKGTETRYKKILAGVLVSMQEKIFGFLELICSGDYTHKDLIDILYYLQDTLNIRNPETKFSDDEELVLYLKRKLNRPCRVCGMVKNVGEPGGGPFLAENSDKTVSPQILESSQINMEDPSQKKMFIMGTHFNPVDLVCGLKDYKGKRFNLPDFVDPNTGFISKKSKNGKELKALELPGLWNGAMSDWNTLFVEIPIKTFNPVKSVNDLLRENHL